MASPAARMLRATPPGPGAASPGGGRAGQALAGPTYPGSRKEAQRFEYSTFSDAGFIELAPGRAPKPQEFYDALASVPGVARVDWQKRKSGDHYMEQNVLAYVRGRASAPLVFELTRRDHLKEVEGRPFTVTACFAPPPKHMVPEAWRILLEVCRAWSAYRITSGATVAARWRGRVRMCPRNSSWR